MKKIPKVFANKVNNKAGNNENVFYSEYQKYDNSKQSFSHETNSLNKNINQKINDIFNSSDYVYKADVEIILNDKTIKRKVIGRNSTNLLTIDNELIPISNIVDIKKL